MSFQRGTVSGKGKIIIIGGSVGGLFAGVLLSKAGFELAVYERSAQGMEGRGAGLVAQREIIDILREIGCERVAQIGVVARERIVLDRQNQIIEQQATPQTQISWDRLFAAFRAEMPPGTYVSGREALAAWEAGGCACVRFSDDEIESADIVLGADGVGSVIRDAIAPNTTPAYAGYVAWRGLFPETDLSIADAALLLDRFAFYHMPHSHILGYVVAGADGSIERPHRRYNWVWYRQVKGDAALATLLTDADGRPRHFSLPPGAMPESTRRALIQDAASLLPVSFARVVQLEPRPFIQAIFDYEAPRMARGRLAFLGDASFIVRPHTAMGVSKAAGDAMALRDHLIKGGDPIQMLAAYDAERRTVGRQIAAYGRRLGASLG